MKIQIKNRFTSKSIFETDAESLEFAVIAALKAKADLSGADLSRANLIEADLNGADLSRADLSGADLSWADLSRTNLSGADLSRADLSRANLSGADLSGADLSRTDLSGADLLTLVNQRTILADGDIIGWKKLRNNIICKLRIPADAKRVGGVVGRKCRAELADVIEGGGFSIQNSIEYKVGNRVTPDNYDPNPLIECTNGIHFFITRQEAEAYQ